MFKSTLTSLLLLVGLCWIPITIADQLNIEMQVNPTRCVALHQGQTCYQLVDINWQLATKGSYCLFINSSSKALTCWQQTNKQEGFYQYDVQSSQDVVFSIKNMNSNQTISQFRFEIAWVYNQSQQRRSSWRLF